MGLFPGAKREAALPLWRLDLVNAPFERMLRRGGGGNGRRLYGRELVSHYPADGWEEHRTIVTDPADSLGKWTKRAAVPHKASWRGHTFLSTLHVFKAEEESSAARSRPLRSWGCFEVSEPVGSWR